MPLRILRVAVLALLAGTLLTACSPVPLRQTAIRVVDGATELVFAPCDGVRVHDVIVRESEASDFKIWHISGGEDAARLSSVRLFDSPQGWLTAADSLTELRAGVTYTVDVSATGTGGRDLDLYGVTLAKIEALDDGEVLGPDDGNRATAMPEADFAAAAAGACD